MTNNTNIGVKKSAFTTGTTIPSNATLDYVSNGQNFKITFANFLGQAGLSLNLEQLGDPATTPVLDTVGSTNRIRNIGGTNGISVGTDASNGVQVSTNFTFDATGAPLVPDSAAETLAFKSLVGGTGVTITNAASTLTLNANTASSVIIVTSGSQLTGALDSSKVYVLDGSIDMTGLSSITVPNGGLTIEGFGFDVSGLTSTSGSYTLFTGGGNLILRGLDISITGSSSKVYDLTAATGNEAVEIDTVNFTSCTSLGEINGYRQGLEVNTGRFGGTPSLTLSGAWNGYRVTTTISRNISNTMSDAFFVAGAGLTFAGRFLTDINCDLGALAAFADFAPANFTNPSSFDINSALFQRNGSVDSDDSTILPNFNPGDLEAKWTANEGIGNTFEGGILSITATSATALSGQPTGTYLDLAGTFTASSLEHFDSPANGQLRHLGNTPREYKVSVDVSTLGTAGDLIEVKIVKWDASASSFVDVKSRVREVFNFTGGSDYSFFTIFSAVTLDQNDYIKLQVRNNTAARDVTAQLGDQLIVEPR